MFEWIALEKPFFNLKSNHCTTTVFLTAVLYNINFFNLQNLYIDQISFYNKLNVTLSLIL